jgi:hypothetical protein
MVADFVSAHYGFVQSCDGNESTHVMFKPGKNWDGYFTNDDVWKQAEKAIWILKQDYRDEDQVFIYDNVTTHLKWADEAISTGKMPKNTPKEGSNRGIEVGERGQMERKSMGQMGSLWRWKLEWVMEHLLMAHVRTSISQKVIHELGCFKGMSNILKERGYRQTPPLEFGAREGAPAHVLKLRQGWGLGHEKSLSRTLSEGGAATS